MPNVTLASCESCLMRLEMNGMGIAEVSIPVMPGYVRPEVAPTGVAPDGRNISPPAVLRRAGEQCHWCGRWHTGSLAPALAAPLRVMFVGSWDCANLCNRIARGLNAAGAVARVWTLMPHPYGYQEDCVGPVPTEEIRDHARKADWFVTVGDSVDFPILRMLEELGRDPARQPLAVTHPGTAYRAKPDRYNAYDQQLGARVRFIGMDSLRLAADGPPALPYWPSYDPVKAVESPWPVLKDKVSVCHSPSNRRMKGTGEILRILERLPKQRFMNTEAMISPWVPMAADFTMLEKLSIAEVINLRQRCDILVDQLNDDVRGFGASAVEAMAQGLAVVADARHALYGPARAAWDAIEVPPPPIVGDVTPETLWERVTRLIAHPTMLRHLRHDSLRWARTYASPMAVGRYFMRVLGNAY